MVRAVDRHLTLRSPGPKAAAAAGSNVGWAPPTGSLSLTDPDHGALPAKGPCQSRARALLRQGLDDHSQDSINLGRAERPRLLPSDAGTHPLMDAHDGPKGVTLR